MKAIAATANPDKLREILAILKTLWGSDAEILPRPEYIPETEETGKTLEENALLKAREVLAGFLENARGSEDRDKGSSKSGGTGPDAGSKKWAQELIVIADDTGLEVDALGGRPGIHTARFAGENASYAENVKKLMADMDGQKNRKARFATAAVALFSDGRQVCVRGTIEGKIAETPRGSGGFGYDIVFIPNEGGGRTFAEMGSAQKNTLSHRARALAELTDKLAAMG